MKKREFCMMPPHEDAPFSEGLARKVAKMARGGILQTAGLNAPAKFDMKGHLRRPALAAGSPAGPRDFHFLILAVSFKDKTIATASSVFEELVFGIGGLRQSVSEYYLGQSLDGLRLVGDVVPVTLDQNYAYYVNANYGFGSYPRNAQGMTRDAVLKAMAAGIDFRQYDNNGDGLVDGLGIIHAGSGAELTGNPNDIWSHKWGVPPMFVTGNVTVSDYYTAPEYWRKTGDMTIGVHCHEIGHAFGVADHYDIDGSSRGEDKACVMASGSWNGTLGNRPCGFCAHSRVQMGFVTPILVTGGPTSYRIVRDQIYMLPATAGDPDLHYLVEFRPKLGQDDQLPWGGVKIDRVNLHMAGNDSEWYPGRDPSRMAQVAMIQPDGLWELEKNLGGIDTGDFWPFVEVVNSQNVWHRKFGPLTVPSSDWPDGSRTKIVIEVTAKGGPLDNYADVIMGIEQLTGDVDGSGMIDMEDFKKLARRLYMGGPAQPGEDVDQDGFPTMLDLGVLCDKLAALGYGEDDFARALQEL